MKKDEITTEELEIRTEEVLKIAEMNVLNATIVEMTIVTVATGNVPNATTQISLLEPNATDVESLEDNTRMVEATTEVGDSSVTIEVEDSREMTEEVKTAMEVIGNVQNAKTQILLLEPNAIDVERHETVETHVDKEAIQTEDTLTLLANQTKGHLVERVSAHLVEMDATVEMSGITTTETTTMVLGIMNGRQLENRENRGHLGNHVVRDPAMHIIVHQSH